MLRNQALNAGPGVDPRERLRSCPGLAASRASVQPIPCKICGAASRFFDRVDFNKYCSTDEAYGFGLADIPVDYHRCTRCGFLFTTFCDAWSADDFRDFIYNADYIHVDPEYVETRPGQVAKILGEHFARAKDARILDYGSGAGVFVERMRAHGFHGIEAYDPFSSPQRPDGRFDIITCFEVMEHTTDPRATLGDMVDLLRPDGCIFLSQTLQPADILSLRGSWWYLAPRNGHVSTYTEEAFESLGREFGLFFHGANTTFGFAGGDPSAHARIALGVAGPSFSTIRLHAPSVPAVPVADPLGHQVMWHRVEQDNAATFRWTGEYGRLQWRITWPPLQRIRLHLPLVREAAPGFAAACTLSLDGEVRPVHWLRGELTAEFDVGGRSQGLAELHTPAAIHLPAETDRAVGIAIAVMTA